MEKGLELATEAGDLPLEAELLAGSGRVITEEDGQTFSLECVVAEGGADWFDFTNPVRVTASDGRLIGFANLRRDGEKLLASVSMDYATPERLSIETGGERLWAYVAPLTERNAAGHFVVASVRISPTRPASGRPALGKK